MIYQRVPPYPTIVDDENQPTYGDEDDPRHPETGPLSSYYEHYIEPSAKQRIRLLAEDLDYDLWDDDDWRALCKPYVPCAELDDDSIPWEEKESTEDEWGDFRAVFEDGFYDREVGEFTYNMENFSPDKLHEYHDLRMLYTHLLKHYLPGMELLLDLDYAHVGQQLFPMFKRLCWEGGCRMSLLGLAVFDAQSPEAVTMLLRRGANPNGLLNHKQCAMMGSEFGTEALSLSADVFDSTEVRGTVLTALLEGGACPGGFLATTIQPTAAENAALTAACERASTRARQRWRNVVAAVGIVACWRRAASEPGSKGAAAAIARSHKRARGESE